MPMRRIPVALCITMLWCQLVAATVVIPPTFEQLVSRSRTILVVETVGQVSEWLGARIVTHVTFRVLDAWKGERVAQLVLTFLGGTVGNRTLRIDGVPAFTPGDRDVLFVDAAGGASPLVGFMHGRFPVIRDSVTGTERVLTFDGRPLLTTAALGRAPLPSLDQRLFRALSIDELRNLVDDQLRVIP